jgi:nucleoside-diphosphate-sugar epimerase
MRVVITGASGFLGGHLAEAFHRRGDEVVPLVRAESRAELLHSLGLQPRVADLLDPEALRAAIAGAQVVIHAAAKVGNFGRWTGFQRSIIGGTRAVLDAAIAAGAPHFIHISTRGVYERPAVPGQPYHETAAYGRPYRWSYYARAKIAAERIVRDAQTRGIIPTTIFRPTWVYGPRDLNIFARLVESLRRGRLRWIGDGDNRINLIYVRDAVRAIQLAAGDERARGQVYNLAADELSPTQREFITQTCELLALPVPTRRLSRAAAHRLGFLGECVAHATAFRICPPLSRLSALLLGGDRHFPNQKLRDQLGWQPRVGFQDGLRRTLDWYLSRSRPPSPISVSLRAPGTTPSTARTDELSPPDRPTPDRAERPAVK